MAKLSVIQMCSVPDVEQNLHTINQQLQQLTSQANEPKDLSDQTETHIVLLPECCLFFGGKDAQQLALAKSSFVADDQLSSLQQKLAALAKEYQITLVAGSIPLLTSEQTKFTNSCCVFAPSGELLGQYNKLHLFDVQVADSAGSYSESRYTQAGNSLAAIKLGAEHLGLTICYDLRFPELFRQLTVQGVNIITVPSAFTKVTGQAHWQALLQARAIENQVYIMAAGQQGVHANGRETWGHSMIISPWGEILASIDQGQGYACATFSLEQLTQVRQAMPVATHNQFISKLKLYE